MNFRIWDREEKRWIDHLDHFYINRHGKLFEYDTNDWYQPSFSSAPKQYIFQFCSDYQDKNGKYVYDGDIIKYTLCELEMLREIDIEYHEDLRILAGFSHNDFEIIGNIWENPELIETWTNTLLKPHVK